MPIYRSPSNRLSEYDYSQEGMYFITICLDRLVFGLDYRMFGKVVEDGVILNKFGLFVEQQIKQTQVVRPYVEMIGYIVMHDHIHMVIQIHNDGQQHHDRNRRDDTLARPGNEEYPGNSGNETSSTNTKHISNDPMDTPAAMSLQHDISSTKYETYDLNRRDEPLARPPLGIKLQPHSLGSIVNHIKGSITRYAKQNNIPFKRQSNYYEHVVRNNADLEKILHYIETNPIRRTEKQSNVLS